MLRFASLLMVALLALPLVGTRDAQAYDAENTHRWIARQAAELLIATYPGEYDELLEYTEEVVEGAFHEDDYFLDGDDDPATLRVMRHFFHAPDQAGLTFDGKTFPNSYEWNGVQSEQNEWDYHDGLRAYQEGKLGEAYFIAGHTVHLISDLTVPAHSHLDDHGPPKGDDYESHCSGRMVNAMEGSLRTPPAGVTIPEFLDLQDAFQKTADASYYRNLYPGDLQGTEPAGVIAQMFPDMRKGFLSGVWEISGLGKEGSAFYLAQPGYYYFSRNTAPSEYDIIDYDPARPLEREYGPVDSEAPMVERMANELVPVAIVHSAATLKLFIDQARSLPSLQDEPPTAANTSGCNSSSSTGIHSLIALFLLAALGRLAARRAPTTSRQ